MLTDDVAQFTMRLIRLSLLWILSSQVSPESINELDEVLGAPI